MSVEYRVCDVFDGLAALEDGSIDLIVTSPPFLALRSYLPADHPDKGKEIGSEPTPDEFIDVMLEVTAELRRVLAPHGSIAIELGDTYAGSGGAGGDYTEGGWREAQPMYRQGFDRGDGRATTQQSDYAAVVTRNGGGPGWPLAKSKSLIPELYRVALAYGINPLTGTESPAGQWRVRNNVTWCRPNPPVGALGDKWRPATSDVVVACVSGKRYWDDLATRKPHQHDYKVEASRLNGDKRGEKTDGGWNTLGDWDPSTSSGAPLLDYWEIPPTGYKGSHYAVFPPELVVPLVKAMCPEKVCRTCGEPSRRIVETQRTLDGEPNNEIGSIYLNSPDGMSRAPQGVGHWRYATERQDLGFTDCGHDDFRVGRVLDPFAGSGTTLMVAHGHGFDAIGFDLDERNLELARERVGPMFLGEVTT